MDEQWAPVPDHPSYEVSDLGRVASLPRGSRKQRTVLSTRWKGGYAFARIYADGRKYDLFVHVAVLRAFVGPRPEGFLACHNNGDARDNRLANLRWDTRSENELDKARHGVVRRDAVRSCKSHCQRGHEFTPENTGRVTRPDGTGFHYCRACHRERSRKSYRARKSAA